jgi:hypothetical protein
MLKKNKMGILVLCALIICTFLTACSLNTTMPQNTKEAVSKANAFEMYNKVSLGMTKDTIDSTLGVAGVADTNTMATKGSYNYMDKDEKYGVYIVFDDKNKVMSKTEIYDTIAVLAPLTAKPVTEAQADKITNQMPYSEVVSILGGEGVECSKTALAGDYSKFGVIRRWGNKDGSGIQVVFDSDDKAGLGALFIQP